MNPKELRDSYNHYVWPSPRARVVAKNLGCTTKRLTHEQALNWLANRANKTVEEFLSMDRETSCKALRCTYYRGGISFVYDPLYGINNKWRSWYR